jgi:peptidoglycan/xylan/chitin deacetylase (PgdA/CDA1 family)
LAILNHRLYYNLSGKAKPTMIITTSWDDGHTFDLRLVELLDRYGLQGTFYVARECEFARPRLTEAHLRAIAQRHEIGAHTLNHVILTEQPLSVCRTEIADSKAWLEDVVGQAVTAFCYPTGRYNAAIQQIVAESGFRLARGTAQYHLTLGTDRWAMPTTLQLYPYPLRPLPAVAWWRGWWTRLHPLRRALPATWQQGIRLSALRNWQTLARAYAEQAQQQQGIWHLWGHSWEIERYGLWGALDTLLQTIVQFPHEARTNSALFTA